MQLEFSPKRVRVLVVLVTLACCAFFLAQGTTQLVAATWMPARAMGSKPAAAANDTPAKGELPPDKTLILARNMFDPSTGPLWPPKLGPETTLPTVDTATTQTLADGQMPPACEGQVRLVAAIYSTREPEWSFASLSTGSGSPLLYRIGNSIDGKEVDSVYPEAVFLKQTNGSLCSLTMFKPPNAPAPPPAAAKPAEPKEQGNDELDRGIRQQSDTKYQVQRSLVDKLLSNQAELMRSARVVPHEENGRVVGVKLYGIRRSSLLGKLGIQNGDMLRTINGFDMSSPDSALEAYAKLRSANNLSVAVVRRGAAVTMEYQIAN
ncbi:MAG TPA: type II secretion system protein GspC [Polyangiales bacterium]|nr:type II secretion system protein GspC [Polyangiales bacterium]